MRIINVVFPIVLLLFCAVSCSHNEKDVIVGKWQCTASEEVYFSSPTEEPQVTTGKDVGSTIEFTKDGKMIMETSSSGENLMLNYTVGERRIVLSAEGNQAEMGIKELSSEKLILHWVNCGDDGNSDDGFSYDITMEFEKIK